MTQHAMTQHIVTIDEDGTDGVAFTAYCEDCTWRSTRYYVDEDEFPQYAQAAAEDAAEAHRYITFTGVV